MNKNKETLGDYPKDMNDPRWFDREFGKQNRIELPGFVEKSIFVFVPIVASFALPLLIIGGFLETAGVYDFGLFR